MTTKRLIIRNWKLDDAINLYKYASDPSVGIPAGWLPHKSIEESKNFIKNADQNSFAVCLKSANLAIFISIRYLLTSCSFNLLIKVFL